MLNDTHFKSYFMLIGNNKLIFIKISSENFQKGIDW